MGATIEVVQSGKTVELQFCPNDHKQAFAIAAHLNEQIAGGELRLAFETQPIKKRAKASDPADAAPGRGTTTPAALAGGA